MNGHEFVKKLKRIARKRNIEVRIDNKRGKGSHGTLYFGDRATIVKDLKKEIKKGLLKKMLSDLGLAENDLK